MVALLKQGAMAGDDFADFTPGGERWGNEKWALFHLRPARPDESQN